MITLLPLMLDALTPARQTTPTLSLSPGVPSEEVDGRDIMLIPAYYVERHFDKSMRHAEEWAKKKFGVSTLHLYTSGVSVAFVPSAEKRQ